MKEKIYRFMQGRYGTDKLNQFIFYLELIFLVLSFLFSRNLIILCLFYGLIAVYLYRSLSRNLVVRSIENQKFIHIQAKVLHRIQSVYKSAKDKNYKYLVCPRCAQMIRVPKGKGNISVKCPSCKTSFDTKS